MQHYNSLIYLINSIPNIIAYHSYFIISSSPPVAQSSLSNITIDCTLVTAIGLFLQARYRSPPGAPAPERGGRPAAESPSPGPAGGWHRKACPCQHGYFGPGTRQPEKIRRLKFLQNNNCLAHLSNPIRRDFTINIGNLEQHQQFFALVGF